MFYNKFFAGLGMTFDILVSIADSVIQGIVCY